MLIVSLALPLVVACAFTYPLYAPEHLDWVEALAFIVVPTLGGAATFYVVALQAHQEPEGEEELEQEGPRGAALDRGRPRPEGAPLPPGPRAEGPLPGGKGP